MPVSVMGALIRIFIDEISTLETRIEYIQGEENFKEWTLNNGCNILIEEHELRLNYRF